MKTDSNDLAYPFSYEEKSFDYQNPSSLRVVSEKGLTKRELFAMAAMQGFCAMPNADTFSIIAKGSVKMADALIEELNKPIKG